MSTTIFDAVRLDVRVPVDLRERLDHAASKACVSRSSLARAILAAALPDPKEGRR